MQHYSALKRNDIRDIGVSANCCPSYSRPPLPLGDPQAGAKHCPRHAGSTHGTRAGPNHCPCCPWSAQAVATTRKPRSRCQSLPPPSREHAWAGSRHQLLPRGAWAATSARGHASRCQTQLLLFQGCTVHHHCWVTHRVGTNHCPHRTGSAHRPTHLHTPYQGDNG